MEFEQFVQNEHRKAKGVTMGVCACVLQTHEGLMGVCAWVLETEKGNTWAFPKWFSLNYSVNHDKIQKQYGYQEYYPTGNKMYISITSTD